ncbi:MAG TPA: HemK2/MTQ2 family protein methyltransferase [Gaiellales bacterium]|nr:HemK2/MTQ2 family protein methyltransferase [Gaiellales bacterium]
MRIAAQGQPGERPLSRRFGPVTRFGDLWLLTPPGVFVPRSDAGMLLEAIADRARGRVLDVCTGSGVLALSVQPSAREVTAVDASRLAAATARLNSSLNRRPVEVLHGDLFAPVAGRRFDVIISNPPYLPVEGGRDPQPGSRAWNGGQDGRAVVDRICLGAAAHLAPGGEVLLVQSSLTRVGPTLELLDRSGLRSTVVTSHTGPLGDLARRQLEHLRVLGVARLDDETEQIVVISGRKG